MKVLRPVLALAFVATGFLLPSTRSTTRLSQPRGDATGIYSRTDKEYYLTQAQTDYVRPGFVIKVNSVTIPADGHAVADVNLTDSLGQPIDRAGAITPGSVSLSWILAVYDGTGRNYMTYATRKQTSPITGVTATQPSTDSGGKYTDLDIGHFSYRFGVAAPAGFDMTATHTVGIYGSRTMPPEVLDGKQYVDNAEFDFRPDGGALSATWDKINQATACNQCHNPLAAHGGTRQDVKLCVLCHSPQNSDPDTGNDLSMRVFIHKIHMGANLPSVKAGTPYHIS